MPNFVTDTNGNSRGNFSVDTQFVRLSADQVASGKASTILAGINNKVSGDYSTVLGGSDNEVTGGHSIAVGNQNLIDTDYVILYGNNNEIRRNVVFFGGDNNNFDTSPTAITNAHIFGLGTDMSTSGDGKFYTVLAARNFSIGRISFPINVPSNYSVILGGQGAITDYSNQTVRNAGIFPKPVGLPWGSTRLQHSSILFDSVAEYTNVSNNTGSLPRDFLPLLNGGEIDPSGYIINADYLNIKSSSGERRLNITVNWAICEIDTIDMKMAIGVDHITVYKPINGVPKLFFNNISKIGDLASVIFPVYSLNDPTQVIPTPSTDKLFSYFYTNQSGLFRAGAQFTVLEDYFEIN